MIATLKGYEDLKGSLGMVMSIKTPPDRGVITHQEIVIKIGKENWGLPTGFTLEIIE